MHAASVADTPSILAPIPGATSLVDGSYALGESIAALAARIHAATYELLVMLAEFDARRGWNTGSLSCAHCLHWRIGIDLGAAREKVRVARALPRLPRVSAEMQRGRLSYAKVRALTRVATPDNEQALVDFALSGTAAHVERFVRGWRRVDAVSERATDEARHLARGVSTWVDDDGMVVIRGRLTPESGALVQRALEAEEDPHDSAFDSPCARRPRHRLPLSGLHVSPVRCPPHRALGGRRRDQRRQPHPSVPPSPPRRARGRLPGGAQRQRPAELPAARRTRHSAGASPR